MSLRVASGQNYQIAGGAAAGFEYVLAGLDVHFIQKAVAAEEVVFARGVVKMPLKAVHAVHVFEGVGHWGLPQRNGGTERDPWNSCIQIMRYRGHLFFLCVSVS